MTRNILFAILYLPALPIIVLCYWLFVYVFHIITFDL